MRHRPADVSRAARTEPRGGARDRGCLGDPAPPASFPPLPGAFHGGCGPPFKSWHPPSLPATSERSRCSAHACGLRPREGIGPAATKQTAGTGTQGSHAGEPTNAAGHSALCRACGSVPSRPRAAPRDEWALTTEHFWSKTEQSPPLHAPVAKITPASACGVAENIRGAFRPARTLLPLVSPAPTPPGLLSALCKHLHVGRGGLFDPYARGLRTRARAHARTHRLLAQKRGDARSTPPPLARPYRFPAAVCTRYPFLCTAVTCVCVCARTRVSSLFLKLMVLFSERRFPGRLLGRGQGEKWTQSGQALCRSQGHWKALGGGLWGTASPGTPQGSWAVASPCQELAAPVGPQRQPFSPLGRSLWGWLGGHPGPARLTLASDGHRELAPWLLPQPAGSHPAPAPPGSRSQGVSLALPTCDPAAWLARPIGGNPLLATHSGALSIGARPTAPPRWGLWCRVHLVSAATDGGMSPRCCFLLNSQGFANDFCISCFSNSCRTAQLSSPLDSLWPLPSHTGVHLGPPGPSPSARPGDVSVLGSGETQLEVGESDPPGGSQPNKGVRRPQRSLSVRQDKVRTEACSSCSRGGGLTREIARGHPKEVLKDKSKSDRRAMGRSPSSRGGGVNKGTGQQGRRGASLQAGRWACAGRGHTALSCSPRAVSSPTRLTWWGSTSKSVCKTGSERIPEPKISAVSSRVRLQDPECSGPITECSRLVKYGDSLQTPTLPCRPYVSAPNLLPTVNGGKIATEARKRSQAEHPRDAPLS